MDEMEIREELARRTAQPGWFLKAAQRAVRRAVLEHIEAGNPLAGWDGKVLIIDPRTEEGKCYLSERFPMDLALKEREEDEARSFLPQE